MLFIYYLQFNIASLILTQAFLPLCPCPIKVGVRSADILPSLDPTCEITLGMLSSLVVFDSTPLQKKGGGRTLTC